MDMTHDIPQQQKTGPQKCYVAAIKTFWPYVPTSINCIHTIAAVQQRHLSARNYEGLSKIFRTDAVKNHKTDPKAYWPPSPSK
jgi:hypothetical protein